MIHCDHGLVGWFSDVDIVFYVGYGLRLPGIKLGHMQINNRHALQPETVDSQLQVLHCTTGTFQYSYFGRTRSSFKTMETQRGSIKSTKWLYWIYLARCPHGRLYSTLTNKWHTKYGMVPYDGACKFVLVTRNKKLYISLVFGKLFCAPLFFIDLFSSPYSLLSLV